MCIAVSGHGDTNIEAGRVVFEVDIKVIGIYCMGHVRRNQEAVCVGLRQCVGATFVTCKCFADPLDRDRKEVAVRSLPKKRAHFFVVEKAYHFDDATIVVGAASLDCSFEVCR